MIVAALLHFLGFRSRPAPDSGVALTGTGTTQTGCLSRNGLLTDATVYARVRDMINS